MTDKQKSAMEWLSGILHGHYSPAVSHARTLKAMVEEPRLPECATDAALNAMAAEVAKFAGHNAYNKLNQAHAYRALYAHLTQPRTKTVEVWRVEWAQLQITGNWLPESSGAILHRDVAESIAEDKRRSEKRQNMACIRVTGPHQQVIPA